MTIKDIQDAVDAARSDIWRAERHVEGMAKLCAGRLRVAGVDCRTLAQLKRELAD
jgi:hypothetical protein